jgi:hypothetical protein
VRQKFSDIKAEGGPAWNTLLREGRFAEARYMLSGDSGLRNPVTKERYFRRKVRRAWFKKHEALGPLRAKRQCKRRRTNLRST